MLVKTEATSSRAGFESGISDQLFPRHLLLDLDSSSAKPSHGLVQEEEAEKVNTIIKKIRASYAVRRG
jgi:hypothetical protein